MKRGTIARRVPRKIGGDEEEEGADPVGIKDHGDQEEKIVKRPSLLAKSSSKARVPSSRLALGSVDASQDGSADELPSNITTTPLPKKVAGLSRLALERSAARQQEDAGSIPLRPSYSASDLADLKSSNVSTPGSLLEKIAPGTTQGQSSSQALDIASKFGPLVTTNDQAYIPSEAEIREKKERRARLAAEQRAGVNSGSEKDDGYIALDDAGVEDFEQQRRSHRQPSEEYDELKDRVIIRQRPTAAKPDRLAETRLVRDDEEIAEGFEDYTEDAPLALSRKGQKEASKKRRAEIAEAIATAQGGGATVVLDSDGMQDLSLADISDGEAARNLAFEAAQQRAAGAVTTSNNVANTNTRSQIPPIITPIPTLPSVLARLRTQLAERQAKEAAYRYRLSQIQIEKKEIAEREIFVQAQLKEVGEEYEKLRAEAGIGGGEDGLLLSGGSGTSTPKFLGMGRGLDSIGGTTPAPAVSAGMGED